MDRSVTNYTLAGAIVSVVSAGLFHWWFQSDLWVTGLYVLVACLATLSVPVAYRLFGYALADDMRWLQEREAKEYAGLVTRLASLKAELTELEIPEGVRQAGLLTDIIDDYHSVVETRFIGKKDSPLAYLGAARRVQKHAVQNLTDVVAVGHSMSGIARHKLALSQIDDAEKQQRQDKHSDLYAEQAKRMETTLEANRKLFDALTETAVEVANIQTFSKFDRSDTLARLVGLAEIAHRSGN